MEIPIIWSQSFDLIRKLMEWFLYDRNLRHERVKTQKMMPFTAIWAFLLIT